MNIKERLKNVGLILAGILCIIIMFGMGVIFLIGAAAVSLWVMQWVPLVFWVSLAVSLFVLGPLSLIAPTRSIAAIGFMIVSLVFGAMMWCYGFAVTYVTWGFIGVIIGLIIAGVGIVPVAMLAALLHAEWQVLILFLILIVLTFGLRALAAWLAQKVDERAARLAFQR